MKKQIRERFNHTILQKAMQFYSIADNQITELDGFENFVYEFTRDSVEYILRIAHSSRRNEGMIQAEVDWINYLSDGGASVSKAILSNNEKLVEMIDDGHNEQFLTAAFVKADGKFPWEIEWTPELTERYGQVLGKMHALTKTYQPTNPAWKRPQWDDVVMQDIGQNLPPSEAIALEKYRTTFRHINSLPKSTDSYGLIHFDAHKANMVVDDDGVITLFDFDDSCYSWFIYDIAIVMVHASVGVEDVSAFTQRFIPRFLRDYYRENPLDKKWLEEISYFMKLREIDLYGVIHRSFDVDNIDDWWCTQFMMNRKNRIEHDVPYLDFDFELLAGQF